MFSHKMFFGIVLMGCLVNVVQGNNCSSPDAQGDCGKCTSLGSTCYFCDAVKDDVNTTQRCFDIGDISDPTKFGECEMCASSNQCKRKVCLLSADLIVIIVPSVVGGLLLIIIIWVWCCCRSCKKKAMKSYEYKESKKEEKSKAAREERSKERKAGRAERTEGIRAKYGIGTETDKKNMMEDQDQIA
eukprot:m.138386 g.138386  ORF g.138386 m.138386 type:complete len:187 (-) comp29990_c0_seq1:235-795(-)